MSAQPAPLLEPRGGLPDVVDCPDALAATIAAFATGSGPVAVDAERASGYRYAQRAYLVQLRRAGSGTALIDPLGCPDLSELGAALQPAQWVLHAASQDLPSLAQLGLVPRRVFDTELAGRLLNLPRVALAPLIESVLGFSLEKGHSAVDWSTRPLPEPWLRYAALDVELLVELRDKLEQRLLSAGKLAWAQEEFAALLSAPPSPPRIDPWRRTSGLHQVRSQRGLAAVRALWEARDELARQRDIAPGRVLPDAAIVAAALAAPTTLEALVALPVFGGRSNRRRAARWFAALERAAALPAEELPPLATRYDGPPPARSWPGRNPAAAARLAAARSALATLAAEHEVPVENLLAPDALRRVLWEPPEPATAAAVREALAAQRARPWQLELVAEPVADAVAAETDGGELPWSLPS